MLFCFFEWVTFYETFGEDAVKAAGVLGIVLTHRNNGGENIELAGFPYHSVNLYLPKLVRAGYRVAICEQLEKPSKEKKIVKRGVTEVVTPGIASDDQLLEHNKNNFLASICFEGDKHAGLAFLDISTGEFMCSEGNNVRIEQLLQSFQPSELIHAKQHESNTKRIIHDDYYTFGLDDWVYMSDYGREQLLEHFAVGNLKGFGIEEWIWLKKQLGLYYIILAVLRIRIYNM